MPLLRVCMLCGSRYLALLEFAQISGFGNGKSLSLHHLASLCFAHAKSKSLALPCPYLCFTFACCPHNFLPCKSIVFKQLLLLLLLSIGRQSIIAALTTCHTTNKCLPFLGLRVHVRFIIVYNCVSGRATWLSVVRSRSFLSFFMY